MNKKMQKLPDYYAILQIHTKASREIIETAYKRLARNMHPDTNPDLKKQAHEKMILLNQAYKVLSDPKQRELYDLKRRKELWRIFYDQGLLGLYRHLNK